MTPAALHAFALSIRQPWASLIVAGLKDVENRTWPCPAKYIGQTVLVHAGKGVDHMALTRIHPRFRTRAAELCRNMPLGGTIGQVRIIDCVRDSDSAWAEPGRWHWLLAEAKALPFVPCKGFLGFWKVADAEHIYNPDPDAHPVAAGVATAEALAAVVG